MILSRLFSFLLRLGELAFAAVVLGVNSSYIHSADNAHAHIPARFIFAEVVAVIAVIASLILLIPTFENVVAWAWDVIMMILWFAVFGLLVDWFGASSCGGVFNWSGITSNDDSCHKWKAAEAFSFLSALFWLASALLGFLVLHRLGETRVSTTHRRRGWYRSSRV
jgi:hypothetical protein